MLSSIFRFALLLFLTVFLAAKEESASLDYLNSLRQNSGMIPLKINNSLTKASAAHANYLVRHQVVGHLQSAGFKEYTGETPTKRVLRFGYPSKDVMENLSVNARSDRASIDDLLAAIYHRFVFLSFDKDEIGMGFASTTKEKLIKEVHVYNLGSSKLRALCRKSFVPVSGVVYIQNACKKDEQLIPSSLYEKNRTEVKYQNPKAVFHPYPGQEEVGTVFYNETPDPLPDYKVSGYPISVQFNDAYYNSVTLKAFRLFDEYGKEVEMNRVLTHATDPHQKLKNTEFALMPIKRLEYGMTYSVDFEARMDGEKYKKSWKFTTKRFPQKLYRIVKTKTDLKLKEGDTVILYFVPQSPNDILTRYRASEGLEIALIDQNTMKVTLKQKLNTSQRIEASGRVVVMR